MVASKQWSANNTTNTHDNHYTSRKKSVIFSARVHVILIPCIAEYESANLAHLMWWNDDDYKIFKQDALMEVKEFMYKCKINDSKDAIRRLYQQGDGGDICNDLPSALPAPIISKTVNGVQQESISDSKRNLNNELCDERFMPSLEDKGDNSSSSSSTIPCATTDASKAEVKTYGDVVENNLCKAKPDYELSKSSHSHHVHATPAHHHGHSNHTHQLSGIQTPLQMHLKSPAISKYTVHHDGTTLSINNPSTNSNNNNNNNTANLGEGNASPHGRLVSASAGGPLHPLALICS